MKIIAKIQNDFRSKFGVPRQSGLASQVESLVIFEPEYRCAEALRGIEAHSHLWLLWQFSESITDKFRPTVRPPRLGGNKRMGVFATRSPFRPNPIGLSSVRLLGLEKSEEYGIALRVSGADLMDGTPIYDIKPYLAYTDSHPDAVCGFAEEFLDYYRQKYGADQVDALLCGRPQQMRFAFIYYPQINHYQGSSFPQIVITHYA